jgi:hypothetical protein
MRGVAYANARAVVDLDQYSQAAAKLSLLNFSARRRRARYRLIRSLLEFESRLVRTFLQFLIRTGHRSQWSGRHIKAINANAIRSESESL